MTMGIGCTVLLGCLLMHQGMDPQGMHITSNVLTPAAPKPAVFHVLAPDMNVEILGGATHLDANSASFISLHDPTQDHWSTTIPLFFARINIECGHQLAKVVMLLQEFLLHLLWKSGDLNTCLAGLWSAWLGWHLNLGPGPAANPPIYIIFPTIAVDFRVLLSEAETWVGFQGGHF